MGVWKEFLECKKFLLKKGFNDIVIFKRFFVYFMLNLINDEGLYMVVWVDVFKEGNVFYNISVFLIN